ncbi:MAG TPA: hypothetical protein VKB18_04510 [Gemmatimonadota bacterium]|nr:hypothetical protein [Gemmatimonadota bacterium]
MRLRSAVPALVLLALLGLAPAAAPATRSGPSDPTSAGAEHAPALPHSRLAPAACGATARPPLYRIDLKPTSRAGGAGGSALLRPASTLFGVSVTADGHHRFSVQVQVRGLPDPSSLGSYSAYVAWAAPADLGSVRKIGAVGTDGTASGELAYEKFLVFVTAEPSADVTEKSGPILLQGLSPSGQMKNMLTEPLLNGGMPPC